MSFFAELKRRNVFKVAVAYAIVAWLSIQVVAIVLPTFDTPRWVQQTITFIIILGFPIALFLAWVYELTPEGIKTTTSEGPAQYHTRTTGQRLNYFIVGVLVLVVAFIVVDNYVLVEKVSVPSAVSISDTAPPKVLETANETKTITPTSSSSRRFSLNLGSTPSMPLLGIKTIIGLSTDGNQLVYGLYENSQIQLYHRNLNQLQGQKLSAIGAGLCISPKGDWLAFGDNGAMSKVSTLGGPPQLLSRTATMVSGCFWSQHDVIYFTRANQKLQRIAATGGTAEPVAVSSELSELNVAWPYGLPDGDHLLLTVFTSNTDAGSGNTALLSLKSGVAHILIHNAYNARYVPTGHIVFIRAGSLWAVPFDSRQLKTTGPEVPVINGVETLTTMGIAEYAFSDDGLLVYMPGEEIKLGRGGGDLSLVWVDRHGQETPLKGIHVSQLAAPRLSPDNKQVAVGVTGQGGTDIWVYDFERGTFSRRTFSGDAALAVWTPDGKRLVYGGLVHNGIDWSKADGTGQAERLIEGTSTWGPDSFTPDGSKLVFSNPKSATDFDLDVLGMTGEHSQQPLMNDNFIETQGQISPDGHWIAYISTETGQAEIYVRPFPEINNGKWQISTNGGAEPRWRRDGKELFYLTSNYTQVTAAPIDTSSGFKPGAPVVLFTGDYVRGTHCSYDVTADGQRFLMLKHTVKAGESSLISLVALDNWFAELKRLAPPAK